jgi:hypothetical protein
LGTVSRPAPVKLIFGFIYAAEDSYRAARASAAKRFGKIDFESRAIPFTYTDHYEKKRGTALTRRFCSFSRLINPQDLAAIKIWSNKLEQKLSIKTNRRVNIDPGYVDHAKLVLASTKNFRHRILIGRGIFAEVTLYYQNKCFRSWELTYPDYRTPEYIDIFNAIRESYANHVRE